MKNANVDYTLKVRERESTVYHKGSHVFHFLSLQMFYSGRKRPRDL